VSSPLPVRLNRDRRHEIRVAETYEADGPFFVDLRNHGDGVHVHVNVEGDLASVARVAETNHYVEGDASVKVEVDPVDEPVEGRLKLATGYGGEETFVEVTVAPFDGEPQVPVDEDLATPAGDAETDDPDPVVEPADGTDDGPPVQVLVVAGGAVVLAAGVAAGVGGRTVALGAGVVVLAAVVAVGLSLR
jgi:hypothetical protein